MAKLMAAEVSPETKNLVDACEAQHRLRRREPRRRTEARAFPIPVVIGLDFGIAPAMTMLKLCPERRAAARRQSRGRGEIEIATWAALIGLVSLQRQWRRRPGASPATVLETLPTS